MLAPFRVLYKQIKDRRRIASVGVYGVINALPRLTSALLAVLYAAMFSLAQYGEFGVLSVTIGLLGLLFDLGIPQTLLRNYYDKHHDRRAAHEYLTAVILTSGLVCVVMLPLVGAGLYFAWPYLRIGHLYVPEYLSLVMLIAFFDRSSGIFSAVFRALERPLDYSLGQMVQALATLGGAFIFVYLMGYHVAGALLSLLAGRAAAAICYQILFWMRVGAYRWNIDWTVIKASLGFGLPLVPTRLANWGREAGLRPVLANIVPKPSVGLFSFASSVASFPLLASSAVEFVLQPYYFKRRVQGTDEFTLKVREFGKIYLALLLPIWTGFILFCPEAILAVVGPRYAGAIPICAAILCASFIRTQQPYLSRQIIFLRQTWVSPLVTIPCAILSVVLALLLARTYGVGAAGWAVPVADAALYAGLAIGIRKYETVHHPIGMTLGLTGVLAMLALWTGAQPAAITMREILTKLAILAPVAAFSLLYWIWPRRSFIRTIARG